MSCSGSYTKNICYRRKNSKLVDTRVIQGSSELMVNLPKHHGTLPHSSKRRSEDNIEDKNSRQKTEMIQYFRKYTLFIILDQVQCLIGVP